MCEKTFYLGTKEYRGYMDGAGQVFINLTPNSIIVSPNSTSRIVVPKSGHVIKLITAPFRGSQEFLVAEGAFFSL